jgi:GNAT superfamily N-acetyltransferase
MHREDLDLALSWAGDEGWNPGLHDSAAFWAADIRGFWLGEQDGEPVASVSVVRYDPAFGFLGLYIVRSQWRGQGLGHALWRAAVAASPVASLGLDGVVAQQANYRKSGFALAHRNLRFAGLETRPPAPAPDATVDAAKLGFAALAAYDRLAFPAARPAFLRTWLTSPSHVARAVLRDGAIAGYGVLRHCCEGAKIGPLFADDESAARALFASLVAAAPPGPIVLDVAEPHGRAVALAQEHGMSPLFETARMYTAPPPSFDAARVWGISTFELG